MRFGIAVAALLIALAAVQLISATGENATFDESAYISAGYSYLKTGDFRMNAEHPPLAKILQALPLLWLKPPFPQNDASWARADLGEFAMAFLYGKQAPADSLLLAARCVTIALTLLLGLGVALFTRAHFGAPAALLALFLVATDPNLIAHGRYATNDLPVTVFFFFAVIAWGQYLAGMRRRDLVVSAMALGLALATKSSAAILLPVFTALYLFRAWQEEGAEGKTRLSVERFFASAIIVAFICVMIILAAYGFETRLCGPELEKAPAIPCTLAAAADARTDSGHFLTVLAKAFHLPDHPYLVGFFLQYMHNAKGHASYLLGQQSLNGWLHYYPVVFLVKTPTAVLLLTVLALAGGIAAVVRRRLARLREMPFAWMVLLAPIAVYGSIAVSSHIDLGVRFLLPVYPFLAVLVASAAIHVYRSWLGRAFPYVLGALVTVQAAECAAAYPHFTAFFNAASGGADSGPAYLVDSNLDWGQDLKRLKRYLDRNGMERVCLAYFGTAPPDYYGLQSVPLPFTADAAGRGQLDCVAAISVTLLQDVYLTQGSYSWLRPLTPAAKIGHSIYVYDLRKGVSGTGTAAGSRRGQFQ